MIIFIELQFFFRGASIEVYYCLNYYKQVLWFLKIHKVLVKISLTFVPIDYYYIIEDI